MSDRFDREPTVGVADDDTIDLEDVDEEVLDRDALEALDQETFSDAEERGWAADERMPGGPNEDGSGRASPPADVDMPRTHDDQDLDLMGGGFVDTHIRRTYEVSARRADLARRLEELVTEAQDWAQDEGSAEANDIAESLQDVYERLDVPPEDTAGSAEAGRAESPPSGHTQRRTGRGE